VIRIVALTETGHRLAERLACLLELQLRKQLKLQLENQEAVPETFDQVQLMFKPKAFASEVQSAFQRGDTLVFICAMGIVFRTLAPVLHDKKTDPPVVVLDERGQFVIPVLSGHEGGANELARKLAQLLGAQLVLTTANAYLKPVYTVGMGCERHCPESELRKLLDQCLAQAKLSIEQIESVSSIDLKADEVGLIGLAKTLDKPFLTWQPDQLRTVEDQLSTRSDYVYNTVGVYGVAESAALYAAQNNRGEQAELLLTKQKTQKATCAIARSYLISVHEHSEAANQNQEQT